ncbi:MAG: hypothetical protein LBU79_02190 [Planctomycetota bacterium]|jgi:hypothetical protein|nr:hypothetical protein [Planctomycetota bacterium]
MDSQDAILLANQEAAGTTLADTTSFLDLLAGADPDYLGIAKPLTPDLNNADWEGIEETLSASVTTLQSMQDALAGILAKLTVEDAENLRIYGGPDGQLHLLGEHPRWEEIEKELNSPANRVVYRLYLASVEGVGLAGRLAASLARPV